MKTNLLISLVGILLFSCKPSESTQKLNIKADNILMKVFETGDVGKLDNIIATDFVNHAGGDKLGLDSLKVMVRGFHSNVKNPKMENITQMANDDYVCDWVRFTGNNPVIVVESMEVTRYANGFAQEHWFFRK
ncbi:hypothetical protein SAMN05421636_1224 [Pricia antarctica]|uniref:SnoaL-like domain-containing protein n=1 Tax=Pricia antarctica TaxID=641691 RepID=A0A1G7JC10_9FLAO|nr:nuclear transport factor 2 family protein [Pricia antarctica]SDF22426.1 hypothetical protein SAMN05421636_1224 [Pricia antarctica]